MDFIFTSRQFSGYIKFSYDDQGCLIGYENHATLTDKQWTYMRDRFPFVQDQLNAYNTKEGKVEESTDLSFGRFWELYGYKKGKLKAEYYWSRLSNGDKARAISRVKNYRHDCKLHNRDMVYAERYLKDRRFDDE